MLFGLCPNCAWNKSLGVHAFSLVDSLERSVVLFVLTVSLFGVYEERIVLGHGKRVLPWMPGAHLQLRTGL